MPENQNERKKKWLEILGWTLVLLVVLPTLTLKRGRTDLGLLREAAGRLWHHETVYDLAQVNEHTKPPLATLVSFVLLVVPQVIQERLWDLFTILAFFAWGKRYATSRRHLLIGVLFTLNAWNAEIRLGQFNLFTLWGILWATEGKSPLRGIGLVLALLFKPVNVVLLPWVFRHGNRRDLWVSATLTLVGLAATYVGLFGASALWADHLTWWNFMPGSVAKHLLRDDNYGFPSLAAQLGAGGIPPTLWLVTGLALAFFASRGEKALSLTWMVLLSIVVSPMAWLQNYSLLLGGNLAWLTLYSKRRSWRMGSALFLIYVFHQGWNPTLKPYFGVFANLRLPLLALVLSSLLVVTELRSAGHSDKRVPSV